VTENSTRKQRLTVMIEPSQMAKLDQLRAESGASVAELTRRALSVYLSQRVVRAVSA
jgi:hypothetical protein